MTNPPTICRIAERSYVIDTHNVGPLRQYFDSLGLRHFAPKAGSLFWHRWIYDGKHGERSVITLFEARDGGPCHLTCLGPAVAALEALVVEGERDEA